MIDLDQHCKIIVETIKEMGGDTTRCAYVKGGLRCYPSHHSRCECPIIPRRKRFPKSRYEEPFWDGLACRLEAKGVLTRTEAPYPNYVGKGKRCDLFPYPQNVRFWLEGKTLMEHYHTYDGERFYWEEGFIPKHGQWEDALADAGGKDLDKLEALSTANATHIGLLILGFDRQRGPFEGSLLHPRLAQLEGKGWKCFHPSRDGISWPDQRPEASAKRYRDKLWLWWREVS